VIPLVGLAIDGAMVFLVKAKLSSAVDAAALAAGRSINVYESQQQNSGPVATVAQQWFAANFPSGWLGASVVGGQPTITIQPTTYMTQTVLVQASAAVPLVFMRMLNFNSITVSASAQSSRRNLNLVLVLDRSGSMGPAPSGSDACPTMIADTQNFVNRFTDGFDTVGLVTFSTTANNNPIDYAPTTHFKSVNPTLKSVIGNIVCTGATSTAQALAVAYQSIQSTGLAGGLNVIVLFTDGQPNEVVSNNWPIKTQSDTRYDPVNTSRSENVSASGCQTVITTYQGSGRNRRTITTPVVYAGGFTVLLSSGQVPGTTGYTGGLYDTSDPVAISTAPGTISGTGCAFSQSGATYAREDIASIPTIDAYANSTVSGYKGTPDEFTSGPYTGQIRVDEQIPAVIAAAFNAADNQAAAIRNNATYNTVIYTIGLDGAPDVAIDPIFLERVANDPRSPIYDSTKPTGYFAYAADASALNQAFDEIASQVLRLAK
jgi:Flp pilus assembly protein TadG